MSGKTFTNSQSEWISKKGPQHDVAISSRIRLARNLEKYPMNAFSGNDQGKAVLEKVCAVVDKINSNEQEGWNVILLDELTTVEKQVLLEKHLISKEHTENKANKALILNDEENLSIMVNEEDHLRIQTILPGLQLEEAWRIADRADDLLEEHLDYAYCEEKGYLTCCPTNVGTGMRASVMLHLPGLIAAKQAGKIFEALSQLGLVVRGLYGEGTEAAGNIYQISNQITLGQKEEDIVSNLATVAKQIIEKEMEIRRFIWRETPMLLKDRVMRAYGALKYAAVLSSEEALNHISNIRLGLSLGILNQGLSTEKLNELMVSSQPGFLQQNSGRIMDSMERDEARAKLFNSIFKEG